MCQTMRRYPQYSKNSPIIYNQKEKLQINGQMNRLLTNTGMQIVENIGKMLNIISDQVIKMNLNVIEVPFNANETS